MSASPWEFRWDAKWAVVVALLVVMFFAFAWHGCTEESRSSLGRAEFEARVRTECLRAGHTPLECKELR